MLEIILLASAISVELEPYAVENPETNTNRVEINVDDYGRPFQWTTRRSKTGNSGDQDSVNFDNFGNRVVHDAFEGPVEVED